MSRRICTKKRKKKKKPKRNKQTKTKQQQKNQPRTQETVSETIRGRTQDITMDKRGKRISRGIETGLNDSTRVKSACLKETISPFCNCQ